MKDILVKIKIFIVLGLFSVVSVAAFAQTGYPTKSVSIQAGLGLSTITHPDADPSYDPDYRSGFNIRASVFLPISDRLGSQLGIGWVQRGYSVEIQRLENENYGYPEDFPDRISIRDRVNYLSIPALLQFNPMSGTGIRLQAGPVLSFALNCRAAIEIRDGTSSETDSFDCADDDLETVDISIMTGVGVNIPVSSAFSVSLDAVYDVGMIDTSPNVESKNRGFVITAGVSLPLDLIAGRFCLISATLARS
ncbi:MAG: PorT family protein, partial [Rhodothermaceae bacterium]|nr:PorT family protein [Rhodothermaceae bacterium]MYG68913.1 PorT family protein [Rhodothermaceae bacterium]MYJ44160.1 PorT family protein [Rhodothermaceae bacterium]